MQDPAMAFQTLKPPHFPEQEQLKCPRCDSTNTKFCYYNNYNLSQPRHFCKNCRRYWTKGGALRNIPVGGGSRKNTKRSSNQKRTNPDPQPDPGRSSRRLPEQASSQQVASGGNNSSGSGQDPTRVYALEGDSERKILDMGGSFSSLLTSSGQFGNIFEGLNTNGPGLKMVQMGGYVEDLNSGLDVQGGGNSNEGGGNSHNSGGNGGGGGGEGGYLQSGDWGSSNGWPDLAIYTPGSNFQ